MTNVAAREYLTEWIRRAPMVWGDHGQGHDSIIERQLAYSLNKWREYGDAPLLPTDPPQTIAAARVAAQAPLSTCATTFYGDLVMLHGGSITLVECDGQAYHDDPLRDAVRTALILNEGLVDHVFRFNGVMLTHAPDDATLIMQRVIPDAFKAPAGWLLPMVVTPASHDVADAFARLAPRAVDIPYEAGVLADGYDDDDCPNTRPATFRASYLNRRYPDRMTARLMELLARTQPRSMAHAMSIARSQL